MINLIKRYKAFFGYFFAAGTGVIIQYIVGSIICIRYFGTSLETGVALGFIISFPIGFILSKVFAFAAKQSGNTRRELIKFMMVIVISGLITVKGAVLSYDALTYLFGDFKYTLPIVNHTFSPVGTISHFAGMGFSFVCNFFTHKKFTFVETGIFDKIKALKNT